MIYRQLRSDFPISDQPSTEAHSTVRAVHLFVGNCCARWASEMKDVTAFETNFAAPVAEIRPRIVEGITEFDEHVQRHEKSEDILTTGVVNQGLDSD